MSPFAENVMLGAICFFVGVAVGQFSTLWVLAAAEKEQK